MDSYLEIQSEIDNEEVIYHPRVRKEENKIDHKTLVGRIVFENYKRATPLIYAKANNLLSEMLQKNYQVWLFESKLKTMLSFASAKGKPPVYVLAALSRMIRDL